MSRATLGLGIAFLVLALLAGLVAVAGGAPWAEAGMAQVVCIASLLLAGVVFAETLFFSRPGVGGGPPARPGGW
jgi:hypothetical protein